MICRDQSCRLCSTRELLAYREGCCVLGDLLLGADREVNDEVGLFEHSELFREGSHCKLGQRGLVTWTTSSNCVKDGDGQIWIE